MAKLKDKLDEYSNQCKEYIAVERQNIANVNFATLKQMSVVYLFVQVALFLVSALYFRIESTVPFFIAAIAVQVLLCLYIWFHIGKYKEPPYGLVQRTCYLFGFFIISLAIPICTLSRPNFPSAIFPAALVMMSLLYIIPFRSLFIGITVYGVCFIVASYFIKEREAFIFDICGTVAAWTIATLGSKTSFDLHLKDFLLRQKLFKLSTTDGLTGLFSKVEFERLCNISLAGNDESATMFMMDIDDFKQFNDSFGHQTGDEILQKIASELSRLFDFGIVGRFGGDEFVVLISGSDIIRAKSLAAELCRRIHLISSPDGSCKVSCSVGISLKREDEEVDFREMISLADRGLYNAKKVGKNTYSIT